MPLKTTEVFSVTETLARVLSSNPGPKQMGKNIVIRLLLTLFSTIRKNFPTRFWNTSLLNLKINYIMICSLIFHLKIKFLYILNDMLFQQTFKILKQK